jgi:hypothetical protein
LPAELPIAGPHSRSGARRDSRQSRRLSTIFVAYGDCGTGGALDAVLLDENVERIPGAHCYEFFAGSETFAELSDDEPGTFYLTDFLLRHFDRLVIRGLGLDRHPELAAQYFGNYRRLVYLAQVDAPERLPAARAARSSWGSIRAPRTGYGGLARPRVSVSACLLAKLIVISARDVPSQVVVKGRDTVRVQLGTLSGRRPGGDARRQGQVGRHRRLEACQPRDCGDDLKAKRSPKSHDWKRVTPMPTSSAHPREGLGAKAADGDAHTGKAGRTLMHAMRHWSVRHSRGLETFYRVFERAMVALDPVWRAMGYARIERPVAAVERAVKGFLFDCRMCGQCVLSSTGMSCPMNCPKELNGPCGAYAPTANARWCRR